MRNDLICLGLSQWPVVAAELWAILLAVWIALMPVFV